MNYVILIGIALFFVLTAIRNGDAGWDFRNNALNFRISDGDYSLRVKGEGDLGLAPDGSGLASLDRGGSWQAFDAGLPNVPVHDLIVHPRERELVAATHGRSVWIADVLPVQEHAATRGEAVHVYPLAPVQASRDWRASPARWFDETDYLPSVKMPFWAASAGPATITVLDADKRPLKRIEVDAKRFRAHFMERLLRQR